MTRPILTAAAGLAGLLAATSAFALGGDPLVTPTDLQAALAAGGDGAPVVLDIRGEGYAGGHIEGALDAPYGLFRGPAANPGALVPVADLEARYEKLGLTLDRPVVVVAQGNDDNDFGSAARVYWTLKSSGFEDISILNGGAQAWVNAGLPLSDAAASPAPSELTITWNNQWTAETPEVASVVEGETQALLVDARPPAFFEGEQAHKAAARPGTLPGAMNVPHSGFFRPGATAISRVDDAAALKAKLGIKDGQEVVSFCNTGHWAATDWFAMSELAGIENVKLYPGSMVEYSQTGGKMENTPGLVDNLLKQFGGGN
ncbi:rhodanese-like domain-containing protein [Frigidibacter sp. MR17.14]|uniref:sulfurtransferase n=1 Tax=Frigidibacter sp. MR17.14 TaxID=3126509 RepID=UPI003012ED8C